MTLTRRALSALATATMSMAAAAGGLDATKSTPLSTRPIRIGFMTDLSGPYQAVDGPSGAEAIRMAVADAGGTVDGRPVEIVIEDHHNDPKLAADRARALFAGAGLDVLIGGVNSDTSLAMAKVADELRKPYLVVGAGTAVQTNAQCSPYVIQYAYNTVALAKAPATVLTQQGSKRWFFVTADYPFGNELQDYGSQAVRAAGGIVAGAVKNPHEAEEFTPFLTQAIHSKADVLGLANGHQELLKAMNAAHKLGIRKNMKMVGLLTFINDIHEMGLIEAQGLYLADSWYWTRDKESRAWAERFLAKRGHMPSSLQAADYSAATQYLKAVVAAGSTDSDKVMYAFKRMTVDDMYAKNGRIRADGIMLHNIYVLRVKSPSESREAWDYYELVAAVPGVDAFQTQAESSCAIWG